MVPLDKLLDVLFFPPSRYSRPLADAQLHNYTKNKNEIFIIIILFFFFFHFFYFSILAISVFGDLMTQKNQPINASNNKRFKVRKSTEQDAQIHFQRSTAAKIVWQSYI